MERAREVSGSADGTEGAAGGERGIIIAWSRAQQPQVLVPIQARVLEFRHLEKAPKVRGVCLVV